VIAFAHNGKLRDIKHMRTETGQVYKLEDYKPTDFVVERIDLTFELDPRETKVVSRVILHRREGVSADASLVFDGDELTLDSLTATTSNRRSMRSLRRA
jgi:aminopeptidase N